MCRLSVRRMLASVGSVLMVSLLGASAVHAEGTSVNSVGSVSESASAPVHGTFEIDGVDFRYEYRQYETPDLAVEEYRLDDGSAFRAELDKLTGGIELFRDGHLVRVTTVEEMARQLDAEVESHGVSSPAASGRSIPIPRSDCAVATAVVSTANALLWGAVGLAVPPAAPVAYVAGAVTSGVISAAGTQC